MGRKTLNMKKAKCEICGKEVQDPIIDYSYLTKRKTVYCRECFRKYFWQNVYRELGWKI